MNESVFRVVFTGVVVVIAAWLTGCDDPQDRTAAPSGASSAGKSDSDGSECFDRTKPQCDDLSRCAWSGTQCIPTEHVSETGETEEDPPLTCGTIECDWQTHHCVATRVGESEFTWSCESTPPGSDACTSKDACPDGFYSDTCVIVGEAKFVGCWPNSESSP